MIEGWQDKNYLVVFDDEESTRITVSYALADFVSGYSIIGLKGWDDFILRDPQNRFFTLPTVPMDTQHLKPLGFEIKKTALQPDDRYKNKIKWYVQPIAFGGDPNPGKNLVWINLEQHTGAVKWWNQKYREMKAARKGN